MENQVPDSNEFLWRGELTEAGRARLQRQPDGELEARLTAALTKMPDAPVSSNFTARVMAAVDLAAAQDRQRKFNWNWHLIFPRLAAAAALIFIGVMLGRYEINSQRMQLAENVAQVAVAQPPPSVDALKNFDVIERMSQPAQADEDLLALNLQ